MAAAKAMTYFGKSSIGIAASLAFGSGALHRNGAYTNVDPLPRPVISYIPLVFEGGADGTVCVLRHYPALSTPSHEQRACDEEHSNNSRQPTRLLLAM